MSQSVLSQFCCVSCVLTQDFGGFKWSTPPRLLSERSRHTRNPSRSATQISLRTAWRGGLCAVKLSSHETKHYTSSSSSFKLPLTWRLIHFQVKYELCGIGHHRVPPVSFLSGFVRCPNCVVHFFRVAEQSPKKIKK